jgi:hypothetical protein
MAPLSIIRSKLRFQYCDFQWESDHSITSKKKKGKTDSTYQHECGGWEDGGAARDIEADPLDRPHDALAHHARLRLERRKGKEDTVSCIVGMADRARVPGRARVSTWPLLLPFNNALRLGNVKPT